MYGPVIQGKLVRLRPPKLEDAAMMIGWFEDLEVSHFIKLRFPPTLDAEREWLEKVGRDPNHIQWVIEFEGQAVGTTGIVGIDWKLGFGSTGTIIGDKTVWGKGIGREMMRIRADYAFTALTLRKLKSGYIEGNEASARAQKSAGYREVGRWHKDRFIDGEWKDHVLTELMREDWEKARGAAPV